MGETITLTAADDHVFTGYRAGGSDARGGIVIAQEIFGLNRHIRRVCDEFASAGFLVVAPSYFDRIGPELQFGYNDFEGARGIVRQLFDEWTMLDTQAAIDAVRVAGKVAVIGYCWGGFIAYLANCRLEVNCAVSYYGTRILQYLGEAPRAPMLYHWAELDKGLPLPDVARIEAARPEGTHCIYTGAEHGFNCDDRASYQSDAAAQAFERTVAFLRAHF